MHIRIASLRMAAALLFAAASAIAPGISHAQSFTSIQAIPFDANGPTITAHTEALKPFTVAGERGVLLGQQDGTFESWILPVKLLSHMTIEANVEGYSVPIDVNQQSAEIEVHADRTVITYSHIAFTVRQIMFSPDDSGPGAGPAKTGPMVLFEFDCLRPTDFIFRFTPNLEWMWPERNEGVPGIEWVAGMRSTESAAGFASMSSSGFYVLHSDNPNLAGALAIPGAQSGILAPYQERPQVHPVEFHLHIDPARDHGHLFPLLMAVGLDTESAKTPALATTLEALNKNIAASYEAHAATYKKLLENSVSIETPDKSLDEAFQWAEISIEQLRAKVQHTDETALVAGYYASGDSARPGFGWFFGRDSLYTLYAINGYGDFALSKAELEFLIHRQRADGKIMHEYSQTAADVDWQSYPYMYAAADSTPLFLLAVEDYVRSSGDVAFLGANREAIEKAWAFETDTDHDTDHDGIYDNSQGTGWVESWPGGMPHQEIYLALLDEQASAAMAHIETLLKDSGKSSAAKERGEKIATTIETEYYDLQKSCYAFSHNADGTQDRTSTVYPAMAWWSEPSSHRPPLAHGEECLKQFADASLATDWGLRDVSNTEKIYDGMSYHQGSVWPLFTGWAALAEYRGNQPLAGYQMLKENANLTRAQDLGADTELLSGDFFAPFGRSTNHQLWSSAMVITPTLRGLFGISIDAQTKTITVNPHLPAQWKSAAIRSLPIPGARTDITFERFGGSLHVGPVDAQGWHLRSELPGATAEKDDPQRLSIPLPVVEIGTPEMGMPINGSRAAAFRVIRQEQTANSVTITVEGLANSEGDLPVYRSRLVKIRPSVDGGLPVDAANDQPGISLSGIDTAFRDASIALMLYFHFPHGEGWKNMTVKLTW